MADDGAMRRTLHVVLVVCSTLPLALSTRALADQLDGEALSGPVPVREAPATALVVDGR